MEQEKFATQIKNVANFDAKKSYEISCTQNVKHFVVLHIKKYILYMQE